jgi:hypothetical protein
MQAGNGAEGEIGQQGWAKDSKGVVQLRQRV